MDGLGLDLAGIPVEKPEAIAFAPFGEPVTPEEVAARLSGNLYAQLADGSDRTVRDAITRAQIYTGSVLRRLGVPFDLDSRTAREVVLIHTVYELHMALGHEEAGREYRMRARDIIVAAWGNFPDSGTPPEKGAAAAVAVPPKKSGRGF